MQKRPLRICTNLKLTEAPSTYQLFFRVASSLHLPQWRDVVQISNLVALHLVDFGAHLYHLGEDLHLKISGLIETPIRTGQDLYRAPARQEDTELARGLILEPDPRQEGEVVDAVTALDGMVVVGEDAAGATAVTAAMMTGVEADPGIEGGGEDVDHHRLCAGTVIVSIWFSIGVGGGWKLALSTKEFVFSKKLTPILLP